MCTSRLHRVRHCEGPDVADVEDIDGSVHRVSLLALDGPAPSAGDWLVVLSGYAIDRADAREAEAIASQIRQASLGTTEREDSK